MIKVLLPFVREPLQETYGVNEAKVAVRPLFHAQMMSPTDGFPLPELYQSAYNEMMQFFPRVNSKTLIEDEGCYTPYEGEIDKEARKRILGIIKDACGAVLNDDSSKGTFSWPRRVEEEIFSSEVAKFRWLFLNGH